MENRVIVFDRIIWELDNCNELAKFKIATEMVGKDMNLDEILKMVICIKNKCKSNIHYNN